MFDSSISAPKFPTRYNDRKEVIWFNSEPIKLESLTGKVVLIDFWTYSCINCQRTLPYLKKWWDKYQDSGLVIIGVHTPEFEFEKDPENIKEALRKYKVDWPVVIDNDYQVWELYANHYWPAKYLIDHKGKIIFHHAGEGNYIETEMKIQSALEEAGFKISKQLVSDISRESGALWKAQTPETYLGYARGVLGNSGGIREEKSFEYHFHDEVTEPDAVYLEGAWKVDKEYLQHARETEDLEDLLILSYKSKDVYLVMESEDKKMIKVYVTLDSVGLTQENAGKDIQFDPEGRSFVEVQFATLYHLISTESFGDHILRLSTTSDKLRCFAFTFGA